MSWRMTAYLGKASLRSFEYIVSFMNRNCSSEKAIIRSMTQMSSVRVEDGIEHAAVVSEVMD